MTRRLFLLIAVLASFIVVVETKAASAAEIKVLCSTGLKAVMEDLAPQFDRSTNNKVVVEYGLASILKQRIDAGEPFDVAVLTPALIDDLVKKGTVTAATRTVIAQSGLGFAIRAGAPKPAIGTVDAFKATLLAAKSISYTKEGASGVAFTALIRQLGVADALAPKTKLAQSGEEVGENVARGYAELGVLPVSEILPVRGVELAGTFPPEIQSFIVMAAGVSAQAKQASAAADLVRFLIAPANLPTIKIKGMERP